MSKTKYLTMATFNINVIDNAVPDELRQRIWEYLKDQTWFVHYRGTTPKTELFVPREKGYTFFYNNPRLFNKGVMMPRTALASDHITMMEKHPILGELWDHINTALGGDLVIEGLPEGTKLDSTEGWIPTTKVPGLEPGYRVYTNAQPYEKIKRSHGIHRDNPNINDETSLTILYVVNPEWYPTWFAENVFYSNDVNGTTGDHQQFQAPSGVAQARDINVGWAEKIVSPVPGRIIAYDSRCLHSTKPAGEWATEMRIVVAFRARRKL
jgi:hypothetical protein